MSKDAPTQNRTYDLQSPGEGVFRVTITSMDGNLEAEAFFAGAESSEEIVLPPGDYKARVEELVSGNMTGQFSVSLPDEEKETIDLATLFLPLSDTKQRLFGERMGFASTLDQRASLHVPQEQRKRTALSRAQTSDRSEPSALRPKRVRLNRPAISLGAASERTTQRRFEIGLSQDDAPHATGGWNAAEEVSCDAHWQANRIVFSLYDNSWERRSKLQMTISVEGLPEIRVPLPMFAEGISVALISRWDGKQPDLGVEILPNNMRLRQLVGALTRLSDDESIEVLEWAAQDAGDETNEVAESFLYRKRADTWAAVLASLVPVRAGAYGRAQWIYNLAKLAPHIPDAGILAAWVKLATGEGDEAELEIEALNYLKRASWAKQPAFTVANSLNLELLNSLRHSAKEVEVRKKADAIYRDALEYSRTRLFKSPFMIWEDMNRLSRGQLMTPEVYMLVADGVVNDRGIQRD